MAEELPAQEQMQDARERVQTAFNRAEVPKIYANAFISGFGNSDFIVILECNGTPVGVLNMSYTLAKALARDILSSVTEIEKGTGQGILTIEVMDQYRRSTEANRIER